MRQLNLCLLLTVAFGGLHILTPQIPLPPPKAPSACISLCSLFSAQNSSSVPEKAVLAGESSRKPEEQDKSFGLEIKELGLSWLSGPLSEDPHHLPAPSQVPAWAAWYFCSEQNRTCCCSEGASLEHGTQAVRDDGGVPQPWAGSQALHTVQGLLLAEAAETHPCRD